MGSDDQLQNSVKQNISYLILQSFSYNNHRHILQRFGITLQLTHCFGDLGLLWLMKHLFTSNSIPFWVFRSVLIYCLSETQSNLRAGLQICVEVSEPEAELLGCSFEQCCLVQPWNQPTPQYCIWDWN